jgi:thioredoxin-related protein
MKDETLNDSSVQQNINGFIFVSTNKNSVDAKKYLPATRYTPTVYFISPKFKVVNTVKGYLAKSDFNLWVDDSKSKLGMSDTPQTETAVAVQSDEWMYDMPSAVDYAIQSGKQIMVYVDKPASKWSKKMINKTLVSSKVKKALESFVWVKIQKDSAEAYNLGLYPTYTPTVYFMKADKTPLATAEGYFPEKDFLLWINYAKGQL